MEFFFTKISCDLFKKGLHHRFFRLNFAKFFRRFFHLQVYISFSYRASQDFISSESSHSISLKNFWQLFLHSSATIVDIWFPKQSQVLYMQSLEDVWWNSSHEKKVGACYRKCLWWSLVLIVMVMLLK